MRSKIRLKAVPVVDVDFGVGNLACVNVRDASATIQNRAAIANSFFMDTLRGVQSESKTRRGYVAKLIRSGHGCLMGGDGPGKNRNWGIHDTKCYR